jgi:hypothetical protein
MQSKKEHHLIFWKTQMQNEETNYFYEDLFIHTLKMNSSSNKQTQKPLQQFEKNWRCYAMAWGGIYINSKKCEENVEQCHEIMLWCHKTIKPIPKPI